MANVEVEAERWVGAVDALFREHATLALATFEEGEPWVGRVFFVHDMQSHARLDLCCAMVVTARKAEHLAERPRVAFAVGGDLPDRWVQGHGTIGVAPDDVDACAIVARLGEKSKAAARFLDRVSWTAFRIHVDRLRYTDVGMQPQVAELSFA